MQKIIEEVNYGNVRFVPTNCYSPNHYWVKNWVFPFDENTDEMLAIKEANLADAVSRVAEANGMNNNEVHQLFPAILRMLKSKSDWTK